LVTYICQPWREPKWDSLRIPEAKRPPKAPDNGAGMIVS
jgi:hypothetical protein